MNSIESDRSHDEARYRLPDNYVTLKPITDADNQSLIFVNPDTQRPLVLSLLVPRRLRISKGAADVSFRGGGALWSPRPLSFMRVYFVLLKDVKLHFFHNLSSNIIFISLGHAITLLARLLADTSPPTVPVSGRSHAVEPSTLALWPCAALYFLQWPLCRVHNYVATASEN